jgi:hypothetical protein
MSFISKLGVKELVIVCGTGFAYFVPVHTPYIVANLGKLMAFVAVRSWRQGARDKGGSLFCEPTDLALSAAVLWPNVRVFGGV